VADDIDHKTFLEDAIGRFRTQEETVSRALHSPRGGYSCNQLFGSMAGLSSALGTMEEHLNEWFNELTGASPNDPDLDDFADAEQDIELAKRTLESLKGKFTKTCVKAN
jgi:hypothetical protein